mgnify:FL=1
MVYRRGYILSKKRFYTNSNTRYLNNYRINLNNFIVNLFLPKFWKFYVLNVKKHQITLFHLRSSLYQFNFYIKTKIFRLKYFVLGNTFRFHFHSYTNFINLFFFNLSYLLSIFSFPFFKKLKFKGKGYYIYKNFRNTIAPQFGYAHRIYIYSYFLAVKFLSKTKIFIFGFIKSDIFGVALEVRSKRFINIFTGRGVRFAQQVVYKKTGKVSAYR